MELITSKQPDNKKVVEEWFKKFWGSPVDGGIQFLALAVLDSDHPRGGGIRMRRPSRSGLSMI